MWARRGCLCSCGRRPGSRALGLMDLSQPRSGHRLVSQSLRLLLSRVSCPAQEKAQVQFLITCWAPPHASVHCRHFSGDSPEARCGWRGPRLKELGHGSGAGRQCLPQSRQLESAKAQVPPSPVWSPHQAPESHPRGLSAPPAQPSVAEGQGAGVGLARSVWLEDQPVEESRSRRAWAQGHLGRECGPRLCQRWAHKARPSQPSRWSWARKAAWGQGQ